MDITQFFGRFHVLVLHLPIGILMLAALWELAIQVKNSTRSPLLNVIWFWGAISAIFACILGWMLTQAGGYSAEAVFIHRTFGILTACIAILSFVYFTVADKLNSFIVYSLTLGQLFLLFSTGHYGANMTHGETYLVDHAPNLLRTSLGFPPHKRPRSKVTSLEQADIILDVIQPMLNKRCISCHNDNKLKGKLNLTSIKSIMNGGKSGPAIVAKDLHKSELYQRITLDHSEKGFMPAEGKTPFTEVQTKTLEWWIKIGAPELGKVSEFVQNKEDKKLLKDVLGIASGVVLADIPAITQQQEIKLVKAGFVFKRRSQKENYLDVDLSVKNQNLTDSGVNALLNISQHVVSLNLRQTQTTDVQLAQIAKLTNLQKLRLERNPITSNGINTLSSLSHLKSLNLYKTHVDDNLLPLLRDFPALKHVYVGETKISNAGLSEYKNNSEINIQGVLPVSAADVNKGK
ncbi:c-type cytochrome domain-containing protein [Paraglaciecola sp.]|uniref:c-type cytochrome domain-containing protein n=1 Tax=Paraglaciecola sp. TaxID=1920173 RepID=UPI003EF8614C